MEIYEKLQEILYDVVCENPLLLETNLEQLVPYKADSPAHVWCMVSPSKAIHAMNAIRPDFDWNQRWTESPEDNYSHILMMLYHLYGLEDN